MAPRLPRLQRAPPAEQARRAQRYAEVQTGRRARFWQQIGKVDQKLLVAMRTRGHNPTTERIATTLGTAGEWGVIWAVLGGIGAAADPQRSPRWRSAAVCGPIAVGLNYGVKLLAGRERPLIEDHPPLAKAPSKLSFPSAHSTSSMAAAIALGRVEPRAAAPLLGLAVAICLCRPFLGMHYPTDVAAGMALGTVIGRAWPVDSDARTRSGGHPVIFRRGAEGVAA